MLFMVAVVITLTHVTVLLCYMFNEQSSKASEESQKSLRTRRLIYGELLLHDWAIQPQGPQLSGKLLSNDISEDDHRYWTNELYWGMGLWRGGGSGVTSLAFWASLAGRPHRRRKHNCFHFVVSDFR